MGGVAYGTGRQALLEAAIRVVTTEGLRGLTYRSVAAVAGVTHGSVRYHFGDWNTLVEEALTYSVEESIEEAELETSDSDFLDFASALAAAVQANPERQAFQYELALEARRRPELLPVMERVYAEYRAAVNRALTGHGLHDSDFADLIFTTLDGIVFQQTVFGDSLHTERALQSLRSVIAVYSHRAPESQ